MSTPIAELTRLLAELAVEDYCAEAACQQQAANDDDHPQEEDDD